MAPSMLMTYRMHARCRFRPACFQYVFVAGSWLWWWISAGRSNDGDVDGPLPYGGLPMLIGGAGNDEAVAVTKIWDLVFLEHRVNGFLAHIEASGDLRHGDCRVLSGVRSHRWLRSILRRIGCKNG